MTEIISRKLRNEVTTQERLSGKRKNYFRYED